MTLTRASHIRLPGAPDIRFMPTGRTSDHPWTGRPCGAESVANGLMATRRYPETPNTVRAYRFNG